MTGWIPDALIPPDAMAGRGGMPLDIPPTRKEVIRSQTTLEINERQGLQNQGFWVDIHLPRDRKYPDGQYNGSVIVRTQGSTVVEIPLEITLLDAYLPDENHSNVWVFNSNIESYFPPVFPPAR